ncbi:MAG TPA: hypothetical protein PKM32_09345, partial [Planctomycetota bacterium]|nr:hypothetical protein [Planctomycetota bacterium]
PKKKTLEETIKILQTATFLSEREVEWTAATVEKIIRKIMAIWEWKAREITAILFVAMTGKRVAPPLFESMELLGPNICRYRLVQAIEKLGGLSKEAQANIEKEIKERDEALRQQETLQEEE